MTKPRLALIDGDILAYKAASKPMLLDSVSSSFIKTHGEHYRVEADDLTEEQVIGSLYDLLSEWTIKSGSAQVKIALSDPNRDRIFRKKIYSDYKANRKNTVKPKWLSSCVNQLVEQESATFVEGLEGDDLLGLWSNYYSDEYETVIISTDKDLRQLPGLYYNPDQNRLVRCSRKGNIKLYNSKSGKKLIGHGFKWFCAQVLMGDRVDNIPGLKGYGPVKVYNLLKGKKFIKDMYKTMLEEYSKNDEAQNLDLMAELCFILRTHGRAWWHEMRELMDKDYEILNRGII